MEKDLARLGGGWRTRAVIGGVESKSGNWGSGEQERE